MLAAFTARGYSQEPLGLEPSPLTIAPGRAVVVSPEQPLEKAKEGEKLPEKVADPKAVAAPVRANTNCNFNAGDASQKPSLIDTHAGPPDQLWLRASYLYWHLDDMPIPQVLVTVNDQTAFGNERVDYGWFNGGRLEGGMWFGCEHTFGIEFGGFIFQRRGRDFSAVSNGNPGDPTINRPFTNTDMDQPDVSPVAGPPVGGLPGIRGMIDISAATRLTSAEVSFTRNLAYDECFQFDTFAGFRYIDLMEDLRISSLSTALQGSPFVFNIPGQSFSSLAITDSFTTRNQLYLGQVGARARFHRGMWFGGVRGSVAIGPNNQSADIAGESIVTNAAGGRAAAPSGLLAVTGGPVNTVNGPQVLPAGNAGQYKTDWFTIAPEVGLQAGAQLSRFVSVHIGYNFLYINNVVRPGDLIDTTVNRKFLPFSSAFGSQSGVNRPAFRNNRDDFIAHGVEFGMSFTF